MREDGGPAFPMEFGFNSEGEKWDRRGMSLRDYFAAAALPGVQAALLKLAEGGNTTWSAESCHAEVAYEFADAMLAEREKP